MLSFRPEVFLLLALALVGGGKVDASDPFERIIEDYPLQASVALLEEGEQVRAFTTDDSSPVPYYTGSLLKPFIVLHLLKTGEIAPGRKYFCGMALKGQDGLERCWLGRGHGELDLPHAIGHSCNRYFTQALEHADLAKLDDALCRALKIEDSPLESLPSIERLVGVEPACRMTCMSGLIAFFSLIEDGELAKEEVKAPVLEGMRLAVAEGTASRLAEEFPELLDTEPYAKTGSAPAGQDRPEGGWLYLSFLTKKGGRLHMLLHVDNGNGADAVDLAVKLLPLWLGERKR